MTRARTVKSCIFQFAKFSRSNGGLCAQFVGATSHWNFVGNSVMKDMDAAQGDVIDSSPEVEYN